MSLGLEILAESVFLEMALEMVQGESRDPHEPHDSFRRGLVWASELMHRLNKTLVQLGCPFQARLSIGGEDEPCISAAATSSCSVQEELLLRR